MENLDVKEYMQQASAMIAQEKYEQALLYLEKAEQADKFNIDVYLTKGIAYANLEKFEEAKEEFEKALKINKKEAVAYFHLGNIEMLEGNKGRGIELYNNAISYGYDDPQVYYSLGLSYEEDLDYELAIRNFSKAILIDPSRADIRIRKIRLYIHMQMFVEAMQALDEMLLSNPDVYEGYHIKYLLLAEQGKYEEAEAVLDNAIQLFPKDPAFVIDKTTLLITQNKYHEAIVAFDNIEKNYELELDDKHNIAMEKSRAYALLEDMDGTISCLTQARQIAMQMTPPRLDIEAIYLLMNCYLTSEKYEEVLECAREIKKAEEENYYALAALYYEPYVLKLLGKEEEAQQLFKDSLAIYRSVSLNDPTNIDAYSFRILALRELKEYEKALELADYLVNVKEDLAEIHTLRALILDDMGRADEAKEEKAKAASIGGMIEQLTVGTNNQ